jgi:hypothetical protein
MATYKRGKCRCENCKKAWADYCRNRTKPRVEKEPQARPEPQAREAQPEPQDDLALFDYDPWSEMQDRIDRWGEEYRAAFPERFDENGVHKDRD